MFKLESSLTPLHKKPTVTAAVTVVISTSGDDERDRERRSSDSGDRRLPVSEVSDDVTDTFLRDDVLFRAVVFTCVQQNGVKSMSDQFHKKSCKFSLISVSNKTCGFHYLFGWLR